MRNAEIYSITLVPAIEDGLAIVVVELSSAHLARPYRLTYRNDIHLYDSLCEILTVPNCKRAVQALRMGRSFAVEQPFIWDELCPLVSERVA